MPIVIDGWNLIRDAASDISDDETEALEAVSRLIIILNHFQRTHGDPIIVVFDSSNEYLPVEHTNTDKLKIVPVKDADIYIKRYIDKIPQAQRRNVRVVSSDNDVFFYAKSSYATPVRSNEFWKKLKG